MEPSRPPKTSRRFERQFDGKFGGRCQGKRIDKHTACLIGQGDGICRLEVFQLKSGESIAPQFAVIGGMPPVRVRLIDPSSPFGQARH